MFYPKVFDLDVVSAEDVVADESPPKATVRRRIGIKGFVGCSLAAAWRTQVGMASLASSTTASIFIALFKASAK